MNDLLGIKAKTLKNLIESKSISCNKCEIVDSHDVFLASSKITFFELILNEWIAFRDFKKMGKNLSNIVYKQIGCLGVHSK